MSYIQVNNWFAVYYISKEANILHIDNFVNPFDNTKTSFNSFS